MCHASFTALISLSNLRINLKNSLAFCNYSVVSYLKVSQYIISHRDSGLQAEMAESRSDVVEIQEVTPEDMELILKYIRGALDTIPEERLHSLFLAADCLQVLH